MFCMLPGSEKGAYERGHRGAQAHRSLESNQQAGKIVFTVP
jgi:hypothetical protein